MRSYQIVEWGEPIELRDPTPKPQGTEVLLRVTAAGICHSDLHINDGYFDLGDGKRVELGKLGAKLPLTLGHEIVGVVEALGPDADGVEVGDARVAFPWIGCRQCRGGAGARALVPVAQVPRCPGQWWLRRVRDRAAPEVSRGVRWDPDRARMHLRLRRADRVWRAEEADAARGRRVSGHHRCGRVGLSGVHIAPALTDAKLVVADVDPEKRAVARRAGAHETVDNRDPDAVAKVKDLSQGGVKAVIDFVGAPATAQFGLDVMRKGGTLVVVGLYGRALLSDAVFPAARDRDSRLLRRDAR